MLLGVIFAMLVPAVSAQGKLITIGANDVGGCESMAYTFGTSKDYLHLSNPTQKLLVGGKTTSQSALSGVAVTTCLPSFVPFVAWYTIDEYETATLANHLYFNQLIHPKGTSDTQEYFSEVLVTKYTDMNKDPKPSLNDISIVILKRRKMADDLDVGWTIIYFSNTLSVNYLINFDNT